MQKYKIAHSISTLNTTIQDYMLDHKSSRTMYYTMQLVFVSFLNIWNDKFIKNLTFQDLRQVWGNPIFDYFFYFVKYQIFKIYN